ncbi:hypothetical protein M409DRAFT_48752 [Zasmidium cellare ATCC 36951]|uniref:Uncharacterized protein n=1 Tax=Zasmidium cellare ATCC 36951 TaxID=1080233 RepID=A0A6A6D6H8_ZASCE|nr:uncharacterized protein M409DRAFT_48752 [Zasmidium cellare ATCC 36951]KAF2173832.1 hypothetical protein M409DRAFT_48752 [Zasmidium cellare ATCC 36951]
MSGPDYWSSYPLNRLDSVRQWQRARNSETITLKPSEPTQKNAASAWGVSDVPSDIKMQPVDSALHAASLTSAGDQAPPADFQNEDYDWPQTQEAIIAPREERYSEETRDVAQTLFSISNQGNLLPRDQPRSVPAPMQGNMANSQDAEALPSRFPKHLFW